MALYPPRENLVATLFGSPRFRSSFEIRGVNHPTGQKQRPFCLDTYTRPKEGPPRRIYTMQPEGSAKQVISSGLLMHRWLSSATCPRPGLAVIPGKRSWSYESSTADTKTSHRWPRKKPFAN